jgi:hypothetical protein
MSEVTPEMFGAVGDGVADPFSRGHRGLPPRRHLPRLGAHHYAAKA